MGSIDCLTVRRRLPAASSLSCAIIRNDSRVPYVQNDLGALQDLPADYVEALRKTNLVPLWPALRSLLPPTTPRTATEPAHWSWAAIRPLLLRAGELTLIEKAERSVLMLANPGRGLDTLQASSCIYLGMQFVLPGETAPNRRHTPNAARIVVEGEGACTIVGGERCPMQHGDLVLTPSGLWHEHRHEGSSPFMWLDVLDWPLMVYLDVSYVVQGDPQDRGRAPSSYARSSGSGVRGSSSRVRASSGSSSASFRVSSSG